MIPRYFDLLVLLVDHRHRAVTRTEILDRVWADVVVSDGALTQAVRTIRRALGDDPKTPRFIRTISRHGYQFVFAPVIAEPDDQDQWPRATADVAEVSPGSEAAPAADPFAVPLAALLREPPFEELSEEERYDAAIRLHELGTGEALARLDQRPGHEEARALLRDARWDVAGAGDVPLLAVPGQARTIVDLVAWRLRRAARLAAARWAGAAVWGGIAGVAAGIAGGLALSLVPGAEADLSVALPLGIIGGGAGAFGGAGVGAGLSAAETVSRSARAVALTVGGALSGMLAGAFAHHAVRSLLEAVVGRDVSAVAGSVEGLVIGAATGAGYALATRRLAQGGMAAPRGGARWRAAALSGVVVAATGVVLSLSGRPLVGASLDSMAAAFAGSHVGLEPLARLLGEETLKPVTRAVVSCVEGFLFGGGVAFGLMRRPRPPRPQTLS
jgi:DNA-binding winged helix-turn-helix (wHTH) protein